MRRHLLVLTIAGLFGALVLANDAKRLLSQDGVPHGQMRPPSAASSASGL